MPVGSQNIDSKLELSESQQQLLKRVKRPNGNEEPLEFEKELVEMTELALAFLEELQSWKRPPLPKDYASKDITFQQLDAEEATHGDESSARFFGITDEGHSVLCNVTGFLHYFYVPVPRGFFPDQHLTQFISYLKVNYFGIETVEIVNKELIWGSTITTSRRFSRSL